MLSESVPQGLSENDTGRMSDGVKPRISYLLATGGCNLPLSNQSSSPQLEKHSISQELALAAKEVLLGSGSTAANTKARAIKKVNI